jgi:hypothetical protein
LIDKEINSFFIVNNMDTTDYLGNHFGSYSLILFDLNDQTYVLYDEKNLFRILWLIQNFGGVLKIQMKLSKRK